MFRSKRSVLVRRLWRSRAMGCEEAASAEAAAAAAAALVTAAAAASSSSSTSSSASSSSSSSSAATAAVVATAAGSLCGAFWPPCGGGGRERRDRERDRDPPNELKALTFSVFERLGERHLEALASAVESKGAASSGCVHVPVLPGDLQRQQHHHHQQQRHQQQLQVTSTVLFLCRLFRWPDVRHQRELKRLYCCDSFGQTDAETVCCNPYHLSKMWLPDSPPPPYSRFPQESSKLQELSNTTLMTTEAEGTELSLLPGLRGTFLPPDVQKAKPWCTLAYWEYKKRLGPLHHVCRDTVGVYYELPHQASPSKGSGATGDGEDLCLKSLPSGSGGVGSQMAQRSRARIGAGLLVSCEPDGVWAYNRGELPVFVNSMTLDTTVGHAPVSHRLPTGHSVKIFDPEQARSMQRALARLAQGERPRDLYSVRISFGKGWGRDYSRQCVLDCPCWLELFFYR